MHSASVCIEDFVFSPRRLSAACFILKELNEIKNFNLEDAIRSTVSFLLGKMLDRND